MDRVLLGALMDRQRLRTLRHAVPDSALSPDTVNLLAWFGVYFEAFPGRESIDVDEFKTLVQLRSGGASPESLHLTMHLIEKLREPLDDVALQGIVGQLFELDLAGRSAAIIERHQAGAEINLAYELAKLSRETLQAMSASTPDDYIRDSIGDILSEVANDRGLKFRRIAALREHILGLQGGASVAIAARPDKGKTSLIAACLTDFAPQAVELYGPDRPIVWFNNEGSGKRIKPRLYQAALKLDLNEIIALSNQGRLEQEYLKAIGANDLDYIRVKDIHGASIAQLDRIMEEMRPCVAVLDMAANVRVGNGGAAKHEATEQIWQEWREMLVRYDCVGLATIQISAEGGNMLYPPYSALKDSKTGVQGATDIIIMMGSLDNVEAQALRGLSSPKNKFAVPGKASCFQAEVGFDGARCVFNDGSTQ